MSQFRKKPVVIEAIQWTGDLLDAEKITEFGNGDPIGFQGKNLAIYTLEGVMTANPGDWIIRGVKGEIYPCRDDIFHATYEAVDAAYPMTQASSDERQRDNGFFLVARPKTERGLGGCMCAIIEVHLPNGEVRLGRAEATTTCPVHGK